MLCTWPMSTGLSGQTPSLEFPFLLSAGLTSQQGYVLGLTRATPAWVTDHEGLIKACLSGEMRKQGFRRVYNQFTASATLGTQGVATVAGTYTVSFTGTGTITFSGTFVGTLVGQGASLRVAKTFTTTAGTLTCTVSGSCTNAQAENVTGMAITAPSEYVSAGTLSTPFHGYGVDGVDYKQTTNGNTVAAELVTEAAGTLIPLYNSASAPNGRRGFMVEEADVNLVLQNSNFGTTWAAVGTPTITAAAVNLGSVTLDLIGDDSAAALEGYTQTITFTADAVKAVSFIVKKGTATSSVVQILDTTAPATRLLVAITWSGNTPVDTYTTGSQQKAPEELTSGVWRIFCLTAAITAANTNSIRVYPATDAALDVTATGNINIGVVQARNGLYSTSPIATTTATVTRNQDLPTMATGAWYNAAASTVVLGWIPATPLSVSHGIAVISDGTANERISFRCNGSAAAGGLTVIDGGASQAAINNGTVVFSALNKMAACSAADDFAVSINGVTAGTDTSGTMPTVTTLGLGASVSGTASLNGCIASLTVYPVRLSNAQLQLLST